MGIYRDVEFFGGYFLQICQVMSLHNKAGLQNTMVGANPDFASKVGLYVLIGEREFIAIQGLFRIGTILQYCYNIC